MKRRITFLFALSLGAAVHAQAWPNKPVHIVVPAPPGSSLDIIARALGDKLKDRWKQAVVVDNKAGAGGLLGMDVVAKAAPDGSTLGLGYNGPVAFGPHLFKKMPYDPARDLLPIVLTTSQPNVLAVQADNPAKTLPEFVAWARKQGGKLNYGSVGNGSSSHLTMELFKRVSGIAAVHVPYAGSPPAGTSLAAGETQLLFTVAPALMPLLQGQRIKLLAVTSAQRVEGMKDVPTVAESGYPGFEALAWNGLFTAAGTPAAVVERINADVNRVTRAADVVARFAELGVYPRQDSQGAVRDFFAAQQRAMKKLVDELGVTAQ
jgi:tripartite-type tricarboxylate transporter receptor subunit TctC